MTLRFSSHLTPAVHTFSGISHVNKYNGDTLVLSPVPELSGSLGDLGTLLPLLLALTIGHSIHLGPTLLFTGAANIFTGAVFGVPLPVQPMKAIAAVAIAKNYSVEETMASGLSVAIAVGILTITGLLGGNENISSKSLERSRDQRNSKGWGLMRWVPVPVVKGIQVGAGLSLCTSAGQKMLGPLGWKGIWWGDNLGWAVAAAIIVLVSDIGAARYGVSRIPTALIIFVVGLILATICLNLRAHPSSFEQLDGIADLPLWPRFSTFIDTLPTALGQLPLTTLNSILAVTHLTADLYPSGFPSPPSPGALGLSISAMNILGCIFGAMPACHGSGGLAGQHKFGARSGASVILLGAVKIVLGVVVVGIGGAGRGLVRLLEVFPKGLLGVMVIAAGVELAKVGVTVNDGARDLWEEVDSEVDGGENSEGLLMANGKRGRYKTLSERERKNRFTVMIITVATLLAFKNDGVGFVVGLVWHWTQRISAIWERRAEQHRNFGDEPEEESSRLLG